MPLTPAYTPALPNPFGVEQTHVTYSNPLTTPAPSLPGAPAPTLTPASLPTPTLDPGGAGNTDTGTPSPAGTVGGPGMTGLSPTAMGFGLLGIMMGLVDPSNGPGKSSFTGAEMGEDDSNAVAGNEATSGFSGISMGPDADAAAAQADASVGTAADAAAAASVGNEGGTGAGGADADGAGWAKGGPVTPRFRSVLRQTR